MNDPYSVLGLSSNASMDEVKAAYRKLAKRYHPDLHPGDAESGGFRGVTVGLASRRAAGPPTRALSCNHTSPGSRLGWGLSQWMGSRKPPRAG